MDAATSGSLAQSTTSLPDLRTTQAIAVPKAPPPITPIRAIWLASYLLSMSLALAIDQGTHASRALVVDMSGRILASGAVEIGLARPQPDWAEQDGDEIVASISGAVAKALGQLGGRKAEIACAGLAS